ncbi:hypothetical protein [Tenacibaculum amylolyticum]|uniref:hypothetical protein n=1 Tax=Tenacibaculum amylolyticum TaxID=104269 RepID=UPI0038B66D47
MIRILLCLFFLSFRLVSSSQVSVGSISHSLKKTAKNIQGSFSVVNTKNNDIATFISDRKYIYGYLTDASFKVEDTLLLKKNRRYRGIVGTMFSSKNTYTFIVANPNVTNFASIIFDFKKDTTFISKEIFNTKGLTLLQSISKPDKVHLLFLKQNTSDLVVKTYNENGNTTSKVFRLKNEKLLINKTKETTIAKLLFNVLYNDYTITKIENSKDNHVSSPPLETAAEFSKLYAGENDIRIVFDKNKFYTQILTLNLNDGTYAFKKIKKPLFTISGKNKTSNSFLYDNLLFTTASSKNKLVIQVHYLKTNELLKEFIINSGKHIPFKNHSLVIQGKKYKTKKNSTLSKSFVRKMYYGDIGISVEKQPQGYVISIGGKKPATLNNPMMSFKISENTFQAINNYRGFIDPHSQKLQSIRNKKPTYLKTTIDNDFTPSNGKFEDDVYTKINNYIEKKNPRSTSHIFQLNDTMIFSFYDKKTNTYQFVAF